MTSLAKCGWLLAIALLPGCYFKDFELKDLSASGGAGGDAGGAGGDASPEVRTAVCGEEQSLVNPDLETVTGANDADTLAAVGWKGSTLTNMNVFTSNSGASHSGSVYAWLAGYEGAQDSLAQTIKMPSNFAGATLAFYLKIEEDNQLDVTLTEKTDFLFVDLMSDTREVQRRVATFTNLDTAQYHGWMPLTFEIPESDALYGKTVTVRFMAVMTYVDNDESVEVFSNFYIDDITLTLNPC